MEWFAAVGGGLFVLASLVVGGRILWRARRTRSLPEVALGGGLFLMGGLGYSLLLVAVQAKGLPDGVRAALAAGHVLTNVVGMSGLAWFTQRVFRPEAPWAKGLLVALALGFVALASAQVLGPGLMAFVEDPERGIWHRQVYLGLVAMVWAGTEALLYWRLQRRRLRIGLADPVVCDRLRLWGTSILCAATISATSLVLSRLGIATTGTPIGAALVGSLGLVTSILLALAFTPPSRYVAWVRARAEAGG